jgi:hypothetical protein
MPNMNANELIEEWWVDYKYEDGPATVSLRTGPFSSQFRAENWSTTQKWTDRRNLRVIRTTSAEVVVWQS